MHKLTRWKSELNSRRIKKLHITLMQNHTLMQYFQIIYNHISVYIVNIIHLQFPLHLQDITSKLVSDANVVISWCFLGFSVNESLLYVDGALNLIAVKVCYWLFK